MERKINILFLIMYIQMGGAERLVYNLVRSLDREKYKPHIAWFDGDDICPEFANLNVPLFKIPKIKRIDFQTILKINKIVNDYNIDLINAHSFMQIVYAFFGVLLRKRTKLIFTVHSEWEIQQLPVKWKKIGKILLNRIGAIVGVNQRVSENARKTFGVRNTKCISINNGVEQSSETVDTELKTELGIEKDDFIIGIIANLKLIKNHKFLFNAVKELFDEGAHNLKLLVIGQGFDDDPENTEIVLRHFVHTQRLEDKIKFLGYRSDVYNILKNIDLFCLTSFKEGLPISLIEAMAAGLPVIGTNVMGIKEIIRHGTNGFLVDLGNTEELKKYIRYLMTDSALKRKLGKKSYEIAKQEYSLKKCAERYHALFSTLTFGRENTL